MGKKSVESGLLDMHEGQNTVDGEEDRVYGAGSIGVGRVKRGYFFVTFFFRKHFMASSLLYGGRNGPPLGLF